MTNGWLMKDADFLIRNEKSLILRLKILTHNILNVR